MTIYTIIELTGVEIQRVQTFNDHDCAMNYFQEIQIKNFAEDRGKDEIADAAEGTLALAGVGSYLIQLIKTEIA